MKHSPIEEYAGRNVIFFEDPEGQQLAIVSDSTNTGVKGGNPWDKSPVPTKFGILGLGPVMLTVRKPESTLAVLPRSDLSVTRQGKGGVHHVRSLYFREPNGILSELATDGPGFGEDEPLETLGESLSLPPFLENQRASIEANLKSLHTKR